MLAIQQWWNELDDRLKALMQRTISPKYGLDWDPDLPVEL